MDRGGDVLDGGVLVVRVAAGRARAVLAAQGQVDVVPARVVAPHIAPGRVEHHGAARIGDVHPVVARLLADAPAARGDAAVGQPAPAGRDTGVVSTGGEAISRAQFPTHDRG